MAAAGSAVGLGNIWKFPYIAGANGGGAFLIVYLICVLLFGMPLIITEFLIGKKSGKGAYGAFRTLNGNNRWQWLSWLCMLTSLCIMGFYFVVTGWCFSYLAEAVTNAFSGMNMDTLTSHFDHVVANKPRMITFSLLPVFLTAAVLWFDVNKGIEPAFPINYYTDDDPRFDPVLSWRSYSMLLFINWLNYYVYQMTPFDINKIKQ